MANANFKDFDLLKKFKHFRKNVETTDRKLTDAKFVIHQLRGEINSSREEEKNLRSQVSSAQNRLLQLMEVVNRITVVSDQQQQNEKEIFVNSQKIKELQKFIEVINEKTKIFFETTSKELNLAEENKKLRTSLKAKNDELHALETEVLLLQTEKSKQEIEHEQKLKSIVKELEEANCKIENERIEHEKTIFSYKNEIQKIEQKLMDFEKERKNILEEFEPPIKLKRFVDLSETDSKVSLNEKERCIKETNIQKTSNEFIEFDTSQTTMCSNFKKRKKFPKVGAKFRQLDFLTPQNLPQTSQEAPTKRRLFNINNNDYQN